MVSSSFTKWLDSHVSCLRQGFYQNDAVEKVTNTRVSTFLNVKKIYEETKTSEETKGHPEYPFISYVKYQEISIEMQSKFETLKSNIFPKDFVTPSELFFVTRFRLELQNKNNSYYILKYSYNLKFDNGK